MQASYINGVMANPTIEISQEGIQSLLSQVEAELVDSEIYRRTMAGLEVMLGEVSTTVQTLIKAVGREAARLTFQQLAKQSFSVPVTPEETHPVSYQELEAVYEAQPQPQQEPSHFGDTETPSSQTLSLSQNPTQKHGSRKPKKKTSKAELAAQKLELQRQQVLQQIGQQLQQAREARSLSIHQLHHQTLVPTYHIEALEAGRLEQLPEDVYIRGFIRQIATALGLNGVALAASLPAPDSTQSVIPSWYHNASSSMVQFSPVYLYLGYTALIAGAVGTLSWMSSQTASHHPVESDPGTSSSSVITPSAEDTEVISKPGLQASETGIQAGGDIAPPEALQL